MKALVVAISTRAATGVYDDRTGPVIVASLQGLGFDVDGPTVVPDGPEVESILLSAAHEGFDGQALGDVGGGDENPAGQ